MRKRGKIVENEIRPLSTAEIVAFKKQINSPLLRRFLRTIDVLHTELDARDRQLRELRKSSG